MLCKNENKKTEHSGKEIINGSKPMERWRKGMIKTNTNTHIIKLENTK